MPFGSLLAMWVGVGVAGSAGGVGGLGPGVDALDANSGGGGGGGVFIGSSSLSSILHSTRPSSFTIIVLADRKRFRNINSLRR